MSIEWRLVQAAGPVFRINGLGAEPFFADVWASYGFVQGELHGQESAQVCF